MFVVVVVVAHCVQLILGGGRGMEDDTNLIHRVPMPLDSGLASDLVRALDRVVSPLSTDIVFQRMCRPCTAVQPACRQEQRRHGRLCSRDNIIVVVLLKFAQRSRSFRSASCTERVVAPKALFVQGFSSCIDRPSLADWGFGFAASRLGQQIK